MLSDPDYEFYKPDYHQAIDRLREARFAEPPSTELRRGTISQIIGEDFGHRFIWKSTLSYYDLFDHILETIEKQGVIDEWTCCMRLNGSYHDVLIACKTVADAVRLKLTL